ncbi:MAG TPA: hypothetical protein VHP62_02585, partial [Usitatibacter sp.]|nr:hypothetical protein [Usitatibacter sp.]
MLYEFLDTNRTAVVERWRDKAARRREPRPAIAGALDLAIPQFLGQVIATLRVARFADTPGKPQSADAARDIRTLE